MKAIGFLALLPLSAACSTILPDSQLSLPPGADQASREITASSISGPLQFLAHDLLEGRGAASRGDELARLYIRSTFELLGLNPGAAGGGWDQEFEIVGIDGKLPEAWRFSAKGNEGTKEVLLERWKDYVAGSGVQRDAVSMDGAELVFAGYGIVAPEYGWDDFKGADLKGKLLLMLNNDPDWDPALFQGKTRLYYGRWTYKYESAAREGAAGAIIIHTTPSAGYPWQVVQSSWSGEQFELPESGGPRIDLKAWVSQESARKLVQLAGRSLDSLVESARQKDFRPVPLGITTTFKMTNSLRRLKTANVLGLLPGSDPRLKDEVVIYSAHHDHLGIGEPDGTGDKIYNGAVDNASGVAQILAIAKAFKALPRPPRRSMLFLALGVEESGLLGSEHYAKHPTFPPAKIAADVNFDGANIWGRTQDVAVIGYGKSSLDRVAEAAAKRQGRIVVGDQFPDRGFYYRSDQFNFARIGVPALYFDSGTEYVGRPAGWGKDRIEEWEATRYHQPSDQLDKSWNFDGIVDDARLGFFAGLSVAESDEMPSWAPGDEFEPARKKTGEAAEGK